MTHMVMTWCDVDTDKEITNHYEVTKVPFLLLMHVSTNDLINLYFYPQPSKRQIEYIKQPRANTLAKVIGAYEEFYREQFVNEREEAFGEISFKLGQYPIVMFIRGTPAKPGCKSSKYLVDKLEKLDITFKSYDI